MTFFQHQDRARQNTHKLVGLYLLSIVCMILSIYVALLFTSWAIAAKTAQRQIQQPDETQIQATPVEPDPTKAPARRVIKTRDPETGQMVEVPTHRSTAQKRKLAWNSNTLSWWQPTLFWLATIPTILIIGGTSLVKLQALQQGGAVVAQELGGRLLLPEMAHSPAEKQLINVVEEMAIAANIPAPFVYILDSETGINAFAAGSTPQNAVIGVTRGCLEQLTRDELQGVIGHEFSHILNGDMKLNMQLIGALHGILFLYIIGRLLTYVRSRDSNAIMYFGLALMFIGGIGHFFGRLIQSAVSRQREFLADASAVQFTRNPEGIAGALAKIEGSMYRSYVDTPYAEEMSHLFFGTALNSRWSADWFATHPPIRQRIKRVESYWQRHAAQLPASKATPARSPSPPSNASSSVMAMGFAGASTTSTTPGDTSTDITQVSTLHPSSLRHQAASAPAWMSQVPEGLRSIQDEQTAIALIYALLLETQNPPVRTLQETGLRKVEGSIVDIVLQLHPDVAALEPRLRLPLLDSVIPVLRQASANRGQHVLKTVQALAKADGRWSLFEFALYTVLRERLQTVLEPDTNQEMSPPPSLEQIWADCLALLSAIAHAGDSKPDVIRYAFRSGVYQLPDASQHPIPEQPVAFQLGTLKQSLDRLKLVDPKLKRSLMSACTYTIMLDNTVSPMEADLMWAIATTLACPLPPCLALTQTTAKAIRQPQLGKR